MDITNRLKFTAIHTSIVLMIYLLMIFLMTYNIYIVFSIIIGNGIGYYIFAFDKKKNIRQNSNLGCCHTG
jgi:lipoprotein signal peptidase